MKPGERNRLLSAKELRAAYLHYLEWQEASSKACGEKTSEANVDSFLDWVKDELT